MFSSRRHYRRRPLSPIPASFTSSFSSHNSPMSTRRRPSPVALYQLDVRDLDDTNETEWNQPTFRIPRPTLSLPRSSVHVPTDDLLWWTPTDDDGPSLSTEEFTPHVNLSPRIHLSEQPFYHVTPPSTPPPLSLPSPSVPVQYQIVSVPPPQSTPKRILHRIRKKRYIREKSPGLCTTLCSGGFGTVAVLIHLCFALALPIAKLVLGILYINDCRVNDKIPLYMIVSGGAGLAMILFLLLSSTCTYYRSSTIARKATHKFIIGFIAFARGMQGAIALFLFIWFFIGNFWVFGARYRVRTDRPNDIENYCHPGLYWFAFYVLIFTYVAAIFACIFKFCGNFFCCGACDMWKKAFS
ncbi:hypothetical protein I4U23_006881 [Adineta vaga]|nr:hypothetical protein I4U23_006881 [Adineta vaga]